MFDRTERIVTRMAAGLALVGALGLVFATVITCISIGLKLARRLADRLFDSVLVADTVPWLRPVLGEEELVVFGVGLALFAALPWVTIQRGHIQVDLFKPLFGDHVNRALDLIGDLALAALAYLMFTRQWFLVVKPARRSQEPLSDLLMQGDFASAVSRLNDAEESQILGLPLWPTYIVAQICIAVFMIAALFCVWRSARALVAPARIS